MDMDMHYCCVVVIPLVVVIMLEIKLSSKYSWVPDIVW